MKAKTTIKIPETTHVKEPQKDSSQLFSLITEMEHDGY